MNRLTRDERTQIITLLVEGMSLRAITRANGVSINTVSKLLVDAGKACAAYQDRPCVGERISHPAATWEKRRSQVAGRV